MIADFKKRCGSRVFYSQIPYLETDVHDMKGLTEINKYLFMR